MRDASTKGRLWQNRLTHCPKGHLLNGVHTGKTGRRERYCKTCANAASRRWYYLTGDGGTKPIRPDMLTRPRE